MLLYLIDLLYFKTHFFSVQVRIIVTLLITLHLFTRSNIFLSTLEPFILSLLYTLIGQVYIDIKKKNTNTPFNHEDIYGYIMKIGLSYYCIYILNLNLTYLGILVSTIFMLLYKFSYNVQGIYNLTFRDNVIIYLICVSFLYLRQEALVS